MPSAPDRRRRELVVDEPSAPAAERRLEGQIDKLRDDDLSRIVVRRRSELKPSPDPRQRASVAPSELSDTPVILAYWQPSA